MIFDLIVLFFGCRRILYSSETPRNCKAYKQKKLCFSRKLFEKQSFFTWCRWPDSNRHGIATGGF